MRNKVKPAVARAIRMATLLGGVVLLLGALSPVSADTIGVAVTAIGSSSPAGLIPVDGTISFYIPLTSTASGNYGVKGTTVDTCSSPTTCLGGTLDMYLRFAPVQLGANMLTLTFSDLDLKGVNDPTYFLESIVVTTAAPYGSPSSVTVATFTDAGVLSANAGTQVLMLPMAIAESPFYVKLHFTSAFDSSTPVGTYQNTVETVRATIRPVPEPLTLATLGLGLLALGIVSRRKGQI